MASVTSETRGSCPQSLYSRTAEAKFDKSSKEILARLMLWGIRGELLAVEEKNQIDEYVDIN
jgi:hypothetical protein